MPASSSQGGVPTPCHVDDSVLERQHADDAAARAVILELDRPVDLCEEGVVLAESDVEPRAEPPPALPHEDRSPGDDVAVVAFDAEALRVAVAPVPGTALTFFVSHEMLRSN